MFNLMHRMHKATAKSGVRRKHRQPRLETLEARCVLSFIGSEHLVNPASFTTDDTQSDNASSSNGTSVAVWVNNFSGSDNDIYAQRFDKYGRPAGAAIQVDFTGANSQQPHVSMDATGRFAVSWTDFNTDGTSTIEMRYFSAAGSPINGITDVSFGGQNFNSDVAASNGSFVVTYEHVFSSSDHDIYGKRFVISGGAPNAGTTFFVNTDTNNETNPSVAMSSSGRFTITYDRQFSGSDYDIYANRYNSSGGALGQVIINGDGSPEFNPSISLDNAGNAVIAYQRFIGGDYGIFANRLTSGGSVGGMITVHDFGGVDETNAAVALSPVTGYFVVGYDTGSGVQVTEVSAGNVPVATLGPVTGFAPAVSIDGFNRYLVTYTRFNSDTGSLDIFSRRDFLS